MASHLQNLSDYDPAEVPPAKGMKFGIVVADWNKEITHKLLEGAIRTLERFGASEQFSFIMFPEVLNYHWEHNCWLIH